MGGIIVDVVVLAIILVPTIYGFYKGLSKILFGVLATLVAIIFTLILFKPVSNVIIEKTQIDEYFSTNIYEILSNQNFSETELIKPENTNMSEELVKILNTYLSEALQKSADNVFGFVADKLSELMVRLLTIIFMIIVLRIGLAFLQIVIDIIASFPIINQIDKSGGMLLGFVKGFFIVYLIFSIFTVISPAIEKSGLLSMIQESKLGSILYNNNLIINFISKKI